MGVLSRWWPGRSTATSAALLPPPAALPTGFVIGGVVLDRLVGRGSTAAVYAGAEQQSPSEARAVKVWVPQAGSADDAAARARFLDEARRAGSLDHPGIARVLRCGSQDGLTYIVSQWFAGSSLARWTRPDHLLPEPLVFDVAIQLCDALAHAHRLGIVHRDIKPSNVLFDAATRRAALTDFGIARAPDAQASVSGVLIGSPVYMAPELLAGQRADAGTDLYALSVLTYELLAGRPPFVAATMGALLREVAQAPPPSLSLLRPQWPADAAARLDTWFSAVLGKDPASRPTDAAAWAALATRTLAHGAGFGTVSASNGTNPG